MLFLLVVRALVHFTSCDLFKRDLHHSRFTLCLKNFRDCAEEKNIIRLIIFAQIFHLITLSVNEMCVASVLPLF